MANPYSPVSVANYNLNPPSDDGTEVPSNQLTWSKHKDKLGDPLKTAVENTQTAITSAFGRTISGGGTVAISSNYSIVANDQGKFLRVTTSGITLTTPDATSVSSPFVFSVVNASSGNFTLDGSGAQTIDGEASIDLPAGSGTLIFTDGSNWFTAGQLEAATAAEFRNNTPGKILTTDQAFAAAASVALSDAATIAIDFDEGWNFHVTITADRTLGDPTNVKKQSGIIEVTASGADRDLAIDTDWVDPADLFPVTIPSGTTIYITYFVNNAGAPVITSTLGI